MPQAAARAEARYKGYGAAVASGTLHQLQRLTIVYPAQTAQKPVVRPRQLMPQGKAAKHVGGVEPQPPPVGCPAHPPPDVPAARLPQPGKYIAVEPSRTGRPGGIVAVVPLGKVGQAQAGARHITRPRTRHRTGKQFIVRGVQAQTPYKRLGIETGHKAKKVG